MWRIQIARSPAEMDRFRSTWEHLCCNCVSTTMFQGFAWNRLAAKQFAARESPYVILAESDSGTTLIPSALTRTGLTMLGEALFDYRDVLSVGAEDVRQAALEALAELRVPITITALRGAEAREHWAALQPEEFTSAPQVLCMEVGAEAFVARHPRLLRTLRRLSNLGVELHEYPGSASAMVARIYELKAQQIGPTENVFLDVSRREFMIAICAAETACEIFASECGSTLVAALVTFRDRSVRRFYTIYFDRQWAQHSPGTALLFEVTRRSLADGLNCDYMTGEQPHKLRFMTSAVPLFRVNASAAVLAAAFGVLTGELRADSPYAHQRG